MKKNKVASILKLSSWIIWIIGFIVSAIEFLGSSEYTGGTNWILILGILLGAFIAGFAIYAFGEIISLLHEISQNTKR